MKDRASILLVHDYEYPLGDLTPVLRRLAFENRRARNCVEATLAVTSLRPPVLVFTDTEMPDGSWQDSIALATRTCPPIPVVVVSRTVDVSLYLDAVESGATDFIVPPFRDADIRFVVPGAIMGGSRKKLLLSRPGAPGLPHLSLNYLSE